MIGAIWLIKAEGDYRESLRTRDGPEVSGLFRAYIPGANGNKESGRAAAPAPGRAADTTPAGAYAEGVEERSSRPFVARFNSRCFAASIRSTALRSRSWAYPPSQTHQLHRGVIGLL